jgi:quercetin 2,3-dioxygenase
MRAPAFIPSALPKAAPRLLVRRSASTANTTTAAAAMAPRTVERIVIAREQAEGRGARVRRSIGNGVSVDPFLLMDHFSVSAPGGFPDHPHRGITTVTYMLEGTFRHEDNKGHAGTIGPGDMQWMKAGKGIIHSEMPGPAKVNKGLQLWVNLSAKDELSKPEYQELLADDIPTAVSPDGGTTVKVLAGEAFGVKSSIFTMTPTMYLDVRMEANVAFTDLPIPESYNGFIYCIDGSVNVADHEENGHEGSCIVLTAGDSVSAVAGSQGARFVIIAGEPINEPVFSAGPFVLSSRERLEQAFRDYSAGKFD